MRELSIFVDESGDFGPYSKHSPYYIISMILHDQSVDISDQIKKLDNELSELLKIKSEKNELSKSEQLIFHSKRELKKDFFKGLAKKEF